MAICTFKGPQWGLNLSPSLQSLSSSRARRRVPMLQGIDHDLTWYSSDQSVRTHGSAQTWGRGCRRTQALERQTEIRVYVTGRKESQKRNMATSSGANRRDVCVCMFTRVCSRLCVCVCLRNFFPRNWNNLSRKVRHCSHNFFTILQEGYIFLWE